jgi:hypothetical protein
MHTDHIVPVARVVKSRRLRWVGHVGRMETRDIRTEFRRETSMNEDM